MDVKAALPLSGFEADSARLTFTANPMPLVTADIAHEVSGASLAPHGPAEHCQWKGTGHFARMPEGPGPSVPMRGQKVWDLRPIWPTLAYSGLSGLFWPILAYPCLF